MVTPDELLALFTHPAVVGRRASQRRAQRYDQIWIRDQGPAVVSSWPDPARIEDTQRLALVVECSAAGRTAFAQWLVDAANRGPRQWTVAPSATQASGLHPLWCIAAARLALPLDVRVEARHDLLGIRLAQIALGFGADTFGGPLQANRKLPLAGVTLPSEATPAGLATLIEQAGLQPFFGASEQELS